MAALPFSRLVAEEEEKQTSLSDGRCAFLIVST